MRTEIMINVLSAAYNLKISYNNFYSPSIDPAIMASPSALLKAALRHGTEKTNNSLQ
jgi:hypothetical protein